VLSQFEPNMRVTLARVRHNDYRGLAGTVKRTVKSRNVVVIQCDNGKLYDANPENLELNP
jgi:hypothetical protein